MAYKHVLAAVDTTDEAEQVIAEAQQVAREHGAKLSLLSVVKPLTHVYGGLDMVSYTKASLNFEQEAREQAETWLRDRGGKAGVAAADCQVVIGIPASQIVDHANAGGVDLIVVGSHGKHGLGLLLGSTANGVLHHADCDVLTVRIT